MGEWLALKFYVFGVGLVLIPLRWFWDTVFIAWDWSIYYLFPTTIFLLTSLDSSKQIVILTLNFVIYLAIGCIGAIGIRKSTFWLSLKNYQKALLVISWLPQITLTFILLLISVQILIAFLFVVGGALVVLTTTLILFYESLIRGAIWLFDLVV